jgi:hypothetical protein
MKFKIGFTIESETLFRALSQFLPLDDLRVEEVVTFPPPVASREWHKPKALAPVKLKPKQKRRPSKPMNLETGINQIIMGVMADGKPHPATELKPLLKSQGFSANSVGSRLQSLREHGVVEQTGGGNWMLAKQHASPQAATSAAGHG